MSDDRTLREIFYDSKYDETMSFDEFKQRMGGRVVKEIEMDEGMDVAEKKYGGYMKKSGGGYMMDGQKKNVKKARHGGYMGGNYDGDEVMASGSCKGTGIAIKGTKFAGTK